MPTKGRSSPWLWIWAVLGCAALFFGTVIFLSSVWKQPAPEVKPPVVPPPTSEPVRPPIAPPVAHVPKVKKAPRVIMDSEMSREEALADNHFPQSFLDRMALVDVQYMGFDGERHQGQIVVAKDVEKDVQAIFEGMETLHYPIKKVVPIVRYGWHDQDSIDDNNTSGFNYRSVIGPGLSGKSLSHHSYGRAIDVNPYLNPFVSASGHSPRPYTPGHPGVLTDDHPVVLLFKRYGWTWGGDWKGGKDYQHFEKLSHLPGR